MNLLDTLSTGELYRIAGYSKKLHKENLAYNHIISDPETYDPETKTGYSGIFDWSSMQYVSLSSSIKKILGYDREFFLSKGVGFSLGIIHPVDLEKLREIQLFIFNYYYNTPPEHRAKLKFSYNIRLRTADNNYVNILRQSTFAKFTDDGKPTLEYFNCTDITGFRFNNAINLTVHRLSPSGIYALCQETEFSEAKHQLSKREKEVFDLAKQGFTTKEIACRLYLCVETVKSHRKHIMAKTGAGNMAAAINKITRL
jgi:DNA-binding CsgD family transcriptional regulator